jgi:hypothetical protein
MENKASSTSGNKFSTSQLNFNLNNAHQLIPREQTFVLDRKLLTIHSEDRDVRQWPNPNMFEVQLPITYTSVSTIQLVECNITTTTFTFSKDYQNTKFSFKIFPEQVDNPTAVEELAYYYMNNGPPPSTGRSNKYYAEISEGFYRPEQLANELEFQMNRSVGKYLIERDEYIDPADPNPVTTPSIFRTVGKDAVYPHFRVKYDSVTQQMWFANVHDGFELTFAERQDYVDNSPLDPTKRNTRCDQPIVWNYAMNWGLPFYLGFARSNYRSTEEPDAELHFGTARPTLWISALTQKGGKLHYVKAPNILDIYGNTAIYMEIEKMNTCDEIEPYRSATNQMRGNDYNGTVNSYFAKIPLTLNAEGTGFSASNSYMYLYNIAQFNPVIDKLRRLKITMRYHDGRLVDFKDTNFNFTMSLGQIHDEIARNYVLRIPSKF